MDWIAWGVFALASGLLIAGLATGRMPNAVIEPKRDINPVGFWALAGVYAFGALVALYLAVTSSM